MRWALISFAGALSFSGALASINPIANAKFNIYPRVHLNEDSLHSVPQTFERRNATTLNIFSWPLHPLLPRQQAGRCGAEYGSQRCAGNQCCSSYGWCGNEFEHCGVLVGCQPQFGRCGDAAPEPTTTSTPTPTPTPTSTSTPTPTSLPPTSSSALPPLPSGTLIPSTNGQCGNVTTCAGSSFGSCCSEYYYCGNSLDFCGAGCRIGFGTCGGVAPPVSSSIPVPIPSSSSVPVPIPSSSPTPTPTTTSTTTPSPTSTAIPIPTNVSTNGRCGPDGNGRTCTGSTFGRCCSSYGWCGNGADDYCRLSWGCQPGFGTCE